MIISATPVPGNEKSAVHHQFAFQNRLCHLRQVKTLVHVPVTAARKSSLVWVWRARRTLCRYTEAVHLRAHAELAKQMGIPDKHIFILDNGDSLEMRSGKIKRGKSVESGVVFVDGLSVTESNPVVLRDRQRLPKTALLRLW